MLNAERFKKEILEILDCDYGCEGFGVTKDKEIIACAGGGCCVCSFLKNDFCNPEAKTRWLLSEYKEPVKLTRFELDVLKYLLEKTQYRFIARERNDTIYIYKRKPKKGSDAWEIISGMRNFDLFINLFPFIEWEDSEPTSIPEVLENCEVSDGESE